MDMHTGFTLVLLGILLSFIIEKFVHWHHCHNLGCKHIQPVGTMMIIGDGVHNMIDGVLIATAYLVDIQLGIATTIAVMLHEIPQEIGDFAVLIHSGFSNKRALIWNFISALTAFLGAFFVLLLQQYSAGIETIFLPLVAGNFLYIAGSDLIPSLHKNFTTKSALLQLLCMLVGIGLIYSVVSGAHVH
jgi:zinc and cadmium transporter